MKIVKILVMTFAVIVTLLGTADALSYADDAISELFRLEIIDAAPETPEASVTREKFCVMLSKFAQLDGTADSALFCESSGLAFGENGVLYIADTGNHMIRKLENGVITTAAGVAGDFEPDGDYRTGGFSDGFKQAAEFRFPTGLCFAEGVLFIADTGNNAIRVLGTDGVVTTIAGSGDAGDTDGLPELATMINRSQSPTVTVLSISPIH